MKITSLVPGAMLCFSLSTNASPVKRTSLPSYVTTYAPVVYLAQGETYLPSDISYQLDNTIPDVNYTAIPNPPSPLTLNNLNSLNAYGNGGVDVFLTTTVPINSYPSWYHGVALDASGRTENAISCTIITVDHGSGLLDAFYSYFYAYNQGDSVLGNPSLQFGDHVGDWEHTMMRFQNGVPQAIWLSQHTVGEAFTYSAMSKQGVRPIVYSASGTHANYATSGTHQTTIYNVNLPFGPFEDNTSQGDLWDPTLSAYAVSYNPSSNTFTAYESSPVNWLYYLGQWGNKQPPAGSPGQVDLFGIYKFGDGPTGPIDKVLNRQDVCPSTSNCIVRPVLTP